MAIMEPKTFCLLMAAVYGFFGVTLYGNANFFWGPDSMFAYFEESCFQGQFFGRALGLMIAFSVYFETFAKTLQNAVRSAQFETR